MSKSAFSAFIYLFIVKKQKGWLFITENEEAGSAVLKDFYTADSKYLITRNSKQ